ncbi:flagellar hook protein FlgE [Campylobacter sputorum]|uniref:flagellar hook protein FlgE n=1 Tax=Campylobacter sputorum TaxID=206 RepID=UPI000B79510F|nr:flagellar hook protein FlgE [Campylobacter sputorum]
MMRSLWSGVSGLGAHQIAMDVEGHNIANVSTTGYKYSRANFEDMMSQTSKIATGPQGDLGGTNSMQVGLGTSVTSVTKIFKQGSVQTTEKLTDVAIQGDGFFIVSGDGGYTQKYTRNGDFLFDKYGNFVNNAGYIVQGWMRDEETGEIDSTRQVQNILVKPDLTMPARATTKLDIAATLNTGDNIGDQKVPIYELDSFRGYTDRNQDGVTAGAAELHDENIEDSFKNTKNSDYRLVEKGVDMGILHNQKGEAYNLREGQGIWVSYATAKTQPITVEDIDPAVGKAFDVTINGTQVKGNVTSINELARLINSRSQETGVKAVVVNGSQIQLANQNDSGTTSSTKNIKITNVVSGLGITEQKVITAYQYKYTTAQIGTYKDPKADPKVPSSMIQAGKEPYDDTLERSFHSTEDLRAAMQEDARRNVDYDGDPASSGKPDPNLGVMVTVNKEGQFEIRNEFSKESVEVSKKANDVLISNTPIGKPTAAANYTAGAFENNSDKEITVSIYDKDGKKTEVKIPAANAGVAGTSPEITIPDGGYATMDGDVTVKNDITYTLTGEAASGKGMNLYITGLTDPANNVGENIRFTEIMSPMRGALNRSEYPKTTQASYISAHSTTTPIYDSLGGTKDIKFDFIKEGYADNGGTRWKIIIQVPEPAKINFSSNTTLPSNLVVGEVTFNPDGTLATYYPTSIQYSSNNGSIGGQPILLDLGTAGDTDGLVAHDAKSNTKFFTQDGYKGGDLDGIKIDESGTIIGSFTNGRSLGLAKIAMAKFINNEGLTSEGGTLFSVSPNSGEAIIGEAITAGRGKMQSSALEMSNVDLSRALTNLIVIQRGFQASSKTITTSDQMLNTLLQLKQ